MGEFDLIRRHFARAGTTAGVVLGIGDDCALLQPPADRLLAVSADLLIEGRHFFAGTPADAVGHKALAVNLSDLAAMGATPLGFMLSIALPDLDEAWVEDFCRGLFALADQHRCPLVGGDTTRGPRVVGVTIFGSVAPQAALRRDTARLGDDLWLTGPIGAAALAVDLRRQGSAVPARAAHRLDWPQPRIAAGQTLATLALAGLVHAAIDLSDGLAGDLTHVLQASAAGGQALGARLVADDLPLDPALVAAGLDPDTTLRHALHGGDDYELLFSAAPQAQDRVAEVLPDARRIGVVDTGSGIRLDRGAAGLQAVPGRGFDHFRSA